MLMGPSGSGKNTLKAHLESVFGSQLVYIVSYTTRAMRPGEVEGKTYHYVSRERFEEMIRDGSFLEYAEYGGHYYGIPYSVVEEGLHAGQILFREIELQGFLQVKERIPRDRYSFICIDAGDWERLARRITGRAPMSPEELALRKKRYDAEMTAMRSEADVIISNRDGHVEEAKKSIEDAVRRIIEAHT